MGSKDRRRAWGTKDAAEPGCTLDRLYSSNYIDGASQKNGQGAMVVQGQGDAGSALQSRRDCSI